MHAAAAYAWARSEILADGVCSPTNGRTSARNASALINLSLDDSAICLLGQRNQRQLISHMCMQPVGNPRRRPPRIIDGTRER